ncbi:hypothetical protein [Kitasatospora sp. MY 5-36]|uniref:hypothetical protein n=1 Tax=Kitasatospora sp. MY 5-36 TaxID=1678027 RepID=UPI0006712101|nr:hypothetical protein [Kitasatospora sp. MY 5-36]
MSKWSTLQRACVLVALAAALVAAVVGGLAAWQWVFDDPGWLSWHGWVFGASLLAGAAASGPFLRYEVSPGAVVGIGLFLLVPPLVGVLMAASATDDIQSWMRTDKAVTATLSGCHVSGSETLESDRGPIGSIDVYSCTYRWTAAGQDWEQVRRSRDGDHPDGHREQVWADGSTGEVAEHRPVRIGMGILVALACLVGTVLVWGGQALLLHETGLLGRRRPADA